MTKKSETNVNLIKINLTYLKKENNNVYEYDIKNGKDDNEDYLNQTIINSFEEAKRNKSWIKGTNNEYEIKEYLKKILIFLFLLSNVFFYLCFFIK